MPLRRRQKPRAVLGTLGVQTFLLLIFSGAVLAASGLVYLSLGVASGRQAEGQSLSALEGALVRAETELAGALGPLDVTVTVLRDWIAEGVVNLEEPVREDLLIPLLRQAPFVTALRLAPESGEARVWLREGNAWESGVLALEGRTRDSGAPGWYLGAVGRYQERGRGNRRGRPSVYLEAPRFLGQAGEPVFGVSFGVRDAQGGVAVVSMDVLLSPIESITARGFPRWAGPVVLLGAEEVVWGAPQVVSGRGEGWVASGVSSLEPWVLRQAYALWQTDEAVRSDAFVVALGEECSWAAFRPIRLAGDASFLLGSVVSESRYLAQHEDAQRLVLMVGAAGLLLSVLLAWFLGRRWRRLLENMSDGVQRLQESELPRGYWPKSRVREVSELARACEELAHAAVAQVREAQAVAPEMSSGEALPASVPAEAPSAPEPVVVPPVSLKPPQAFMQALGGARRQLRQAREKIAVLQAERLAEAPPEVDADFYVPGGVGEIGWSVDVIGCITALDGPVAEVFGFGPEELVGKPVTFLSSPEQGREDLALLIRLLAGEVCRGYQTSHRRKDGQWVRLVVAGEVRRDAEGRAVGAQGTAVVAESGGTSP